MMTATDRAMSAVGRKTRIRRRVQGCAAVLKVLFFVWLLLVKVSPWIDDHLVLLCQWIAGIAGVWLLGVAYLVVSSYDRKGGMRL